MAIWRWKRCLWSQCAWIQDVDNDSCVFVLISQKGVRLFARKMNRTCVNLYINGETNGLTVSCYVQDINREKGQRSSSAVQLGLKVGKQHVKEEERDQIKFKSKHIRVGFNRKDRVTLYNLYTSKVHTKFEIQLPIVIHRVIECQGENA